jgi:hypothetical protein
MNSAAKFLSITKANAKPYMSASDLRMEAAQQQVAKELECLGRHSSNMRGGKTARRLRKRKK